MPTPPPPGLKWIGGAAVGSWSVFVVTFDAASETETSTVGCSVRPYGDADAYTAVVPLLETGVAASPPTEHETVSSCVTLDSEYVTVTSA